MICILTDRPYVIINPELEFDSYCRQVRVLCVADKEAVQMRRTLEDLYYGSITPCDQQMAHGSELKKVVGQVTKCEEQLTELLDEDDKRTACREDNQFPPAGGFSVCGLLCGHPLFTPNSPRGKVAENKKNQPFPKKRLVSCGAAIRI